jgi:Tol biopolymer transport system component
LCTSPDGEYIAYNTIPGNSDIKILTADGKFEFPLVTHPANDKVIGWMPGRKVFLFVSDRSGTWDLWALPVINGKPDGEAQRLFTEFGEVAPIGITEKGDCFVGFSKRNFNAYIIPVNKTTGKPDEKSGMPLAGSLFSINWSPDGQQMAFVKQRKNSFELILHDTNNGNERRLAKELLYAIGPYWSSDGNSIYIFGMDQRISQKGYKGGIYTVDIETGKINENFQISEFNYTPSVDDALPISGHVVSADNQKIYLLFQNDWIVERDLNTGKDIILYRHPNFKRGVLQLSPDGKKLLFAINNKGEELSRLMTMTVKGEDIKELCVSQLSKISGSAFWSPNGKFVYFAERAEGTSLWRVNSDGGTPEKVWHTVKRAESFAIHPSGKEISYTVRERTTEIRVVQGLIQELDKIYGVNE